MPPPPLANLSLWQRSVQSHPLLLHTPPPLPESTDIIIVGGGLCGAVLAHSLLTSDPDVRVTLLEARALASGASGRNAGHCRPDPSRGFSLFERYHGGVQAREVLESEGVVLDRVDAFVKQHKIECEWTRRRTYDVSLSDEFTQYSETAEAGLLKQGGSPGTTRLDGQAAQDATRVPGAQTAWAWDAATVNPAQLTLGVHQQCATFGERYAAYQFTPVTAVEKEGGRWRVATPTGEVVADKVVWANNAYVAEVCTELKDIVVPVRAQAHKLSPPPDASFAPLDSSYSLRKSLSLFYSVAPRPDGSVILGVSRGHLPISDTGNRVDDDAFNPALASAALEAFSALVPGGWTAPAPEELVRLSERVASAQGGREEEDGTTGTDQSVLPAHELQTADAPWPTSGAGFEYAWSGIIGCTPDVVPLIGDRVGCEGQYLAVGYNGHGMARIFLTAPALAAYILTGQWDSAMPACFRVTEERMQRLRDGVASGTMRAA